MCIIHVHKCMLMHRGSGKRASTLIPWCMHVAEWTALSVRSHLPLVWARLSVVCLWLALIDLEIWRTHVSSSHLAIGALKLWMDTTESTLLLGSEYSDTNSFTWMISALTITYNGDISIDTKNHLCIYTHLW